jgi:Fe-S cluster assembly protein SufB
MGWRDPVCYDAAAGEGLTEDVVRTMSASKQECPELLERRLAALATFRRLGLPSWLDAEALSGLNLDRIRFYARPESGRSDRWSTVPAPMRATFERLGIPEAEQRHLAGLCAQYDSEVVYQRNRAELEPMGVIFTDMDTAVQEHWDLVEPYLGSVVAPDDNKYAALNDVVRSGGTFLYVPAGVRVERPLQAYYRVNAERLGQSEHTLVVVGEGSYVHYVDACSATTYGTASLHVGVVEVVAEAGARCRVTGIQNWPKNVFNLSTKRAVARREATVEWIDANVGARVTMTYPCVLLAGNGARGSVLSIGYAAGGQYQETGAKMIHLAPGTTSTVVSKSISRGGGRAGYRGVVHVAPEAADARSFVRCDSLILDDQSRSDTHPCLEMEEPTARIGHEATVSRIDENRLFYLMSRGLREDEAVALLVSGFIEPINRELPLECAAEVNRLIALDMATAGAVG